MTTGVDNAFVPGVAASELYIPDQLIAGRFPLVTGQNITLTGGALLTRGAVLGQVTIGTASAAAKGGGNTGTGTCTSVSAKGNAKIGVYKAIVEIAGTNSATWNLYDPNGRLIDQKQYSGSGATAVFSNDQVAYTITDGGTDFVVGDEFDITVAAGSNKYKLSVATATDGSQIPAAILADTTDASGGDVLCGVYLTGEFNSAAINYDASWSVSTLQPLLQAKSIFLRTAVPSDVPS